MDENPAFGDRYGMFSYDITFTVINREPTINNQQSTMTEEKE